MSSSFDGNDPAEAEPSTSNPRSSGRDTYPKIVLDESEAEKLENNQRWSGAHVRPHPSERLVPEQRTTYDPSSSSQSAATFPPVAESSQVNYKDLLTFAKVTIRATSYQPRSFRKQKRVLMDQDCFGLTRLSTRHVINTRKSHRPYRITELPHNHDWTNWQRFSEKHAYKLAMCDEKSCPLKYKPVLYDNTPGSDSRDMFHQVSDKELLEANYNVPEDQMDGILESFETQGEFMGRHYAKESGGLVNTQDTRREWWAKLHSEKLEETVKREMTEDQRSAIEV